jgi:hypothetical protein
MFTSDEGRYIIRAERGVWNLGGAGGEKEDFLTDAWLKRTSGAIEGRAPGVTADRGGGGSTGPVLNGSGKQPRCLALVPDELDCFPVPWPVMWTGACRGTFRAPARWGEVVMGWIQTLKINCQPLVSCSPPPSFDLCVPSLPLNCFKLLRRCRDRPWMQRDVNALGAIRPCLHPGS